MVLRKHFLKLFRYRSEYRMEQHSHPKLYMDYTKDRNWYKIKVSFNLGLLGNYTYTGWAKVPIGTKEAGSQLIPENF